MGMSTACVALVAGHFSDNGFLAPANTTVTLQFYGDEPFEVSTLASSLVVRSVVDTYTRSSEQLL